MSFVSLFQQDGSELSRLDLLRIEAPGANFFTKRGVCYREAIVFYIKRIGRFLSASFSIFKDPLQEFWQSRSPFLAMNCGLEAFHRAFGQVQTIVLFPIVIVLGIVQPNIYKVMGDRILASLPPLIKDFFALPSFQENKNFYIDLLVARPSLRGPFLQVLGEMPKEDLSELPSDKLEMLEDGDLKRILTLMREKRLDFVKNVLEIYVWVRTFCPLEDMLGKLSEMDNCKKQQFFQIMLYMSEKAKEIQSLIREASVDYEREEALQDRLEMVLLEMSKLLENPSESLGFLRGNQRSFENIREKFVICEKASCLSFGRVINLIDGIKGDLLIAMGNLLSEEKIDTVLRFIQEKDGLREFEKSLETNIEKKLSICERSSLELKEVLQAVNIVEGQLDEVIKLSPQKLDDFLQFIQIERNYETFKKGLENIEQKLLIYEKSLTFKIGDILQITFGWEEEELLKIAKLSSKEIDESLDMYLSGK